MSVSRNRQTRPLLLRFRGAGGGLLVLLLFLLSISISAEAIDISYSFSNDVKYSYFTESERDSLVERLEVNYNVGILRTGLLLEARQPLPKMGDMDQSIGPVNIRKLFFEVEKSGFTVRAGDFPVIFGRGLSINLFRDDNVRQDTEPEGIKLNYLNDYIEFTAFSGHVRKFVGPYQINDISYETDDRRNHLFRGAAANVSPFLDSSSSLLQPLQFGLHYVRFRSIEEYDFGNQGLRAYEDRRTLQGATLTYAGDFFDIYGEYVTGERIDNELYTTNENGHQKGDAKYTLVENDTIQAFYGALNTFYGDFSLLAEYKDYRGLLFSDASPSHLAPAGNRASPSRPYNNPPTVVTEHTSRLLGRDMYQPIKLENERGYRIELEWSPTYSTRILLDYTRAEDRDGELYFQEYFVEFAHTLMGDRLEFLGMINAGDIGDKADRVGGWLKTSYQLNKKQSIALTTEYLDGTLKNKENEVGQYYVLTFSQAADQQGDNFWLNLLKKSWILSGTLELSNEEDEDGEDKWLGMMLDYKFSDNHLFRFFYGNRRAGLNCNGAICVPEPAFEGVECQLMSVF